MKHLYRFRGFLREKISKVIKEGSEFITKDDFIAYHGSSNKVEDFNKFPLWVTTSQLRARSFSIDMKWDEKRQRNVFRGAKLGDIGHVYKLKIKNATIIREFYDEFLLNSANIEVIDSYMVRAIRNPLNRRSIVAEIIKDENSNREVFLESKEEDLEFDFLLNVSKFRDAIYKIVEVHEKFYYGTNKIVGDSKFKGDIKKIIDSEISGGGDEILDSLLNTIKDSEKRLLGDNKFEIGVEGVDHSIFSLLDDIVNPFKDAIDNRTREDFIFVFGNECSEVIKGCDETWVWKYSTLEGHGEEDENIGDDDDDDDEEDWIDEEDMEFLQKLSSHEKLVKYLEDYIGKKIEDFTFTDKFEAYHHLENHVVIKDILKYDSEESKNNMRVFLKNVKEYLGL